MLLLNPHLRTLLSTSALACALLPSHSAVAAPLQQPSSGTLTLPPIPSAQPSAAQPSGQPSATAAAVTAPQPPAALPPVSRRDQKLAARHYKAGRKYFQHGNLQRAEDEYLLASSLVPGSQLYAMERELTRAKLVSSLLQQASTERTAGKPQAATAALERAHELDPANPAVEEQVRAQATEAQPAVLPSGGLARIETGFVSLEPKSVVPQPMHYRGSGHEMVLQTFQRYGITATVDDSVPNQFLKADAEALDFQQAVDTTMLLTNSFYVVLDPHRVLVAKDTRENREKFERLFLETVYMPGLTSTELQDASNVVKQVIEVKQVTTNAANGSITIRAPQRQLETVNQVLTDLYDGHSQVLFKLTLYQIADTKERVVGATLPSQITLFNIPAEIASLYAQYGSLIQQIIASGLVSANNPLEILAALIASGELTNSPFTQGFSTFGGGLTEFGMSLGSGATGNASLNSSRTRQLDQVQLRVGNHETATFRLGSRYPIITASYSSGVSEASLGLAGTNIMKLLGQAGISPSALATVQATPNIQYQDLGLTVKATPVIERSGDVSVKLDVTISSLGGASLNNVPILNNREFQTTIGVKDGEASVITSTLTRQESKSLTGIPGLNDIPGFPATNVDKTVDTSQLVMVLEPRVVRLEHPNGMGKLILLPLH